MKNIFLLMLLAFCAPARAAQDLVSLYGVTEDNVANRALLSIVGSVEAAVDPTSKGDPSIIMNGRLRRVTVSDANRVHVTSITPTGVYSTFYGPATGLTAIPSAQLSGTVPQGLVNLSTVTTALTGKLDTGAQAASVANGVYTNGSYANPSWITSLATGKVDLSTVTTALNGKLDTGAQAASVANGVYTNGSYANPSWITSLSTGKVDLSTVTTALNAKLSATATVSPTLIDLSTVTSALNGKQATGNYITALTGNMTATGPGSVTATIASVPQAAVNLSTVTARFLADEATIATAAYLNTDQTFTGLNRLQGVNIFGNYLSSFYTDQYGFLSVGYDADSDHNTGFINYSGYHGGQSRLRSILFFDGTGSPILALAGMGEHSSVQINKNINEFDGHTLDVNGGGYFSSSMTVDGGYYGSGIGLTNVAAVTASALASNGGNCSSGQAALGVDASGNAEGCWTPTAVVTAANNTLTGVSVGSPNGADNVAYGHLANNLQATGDYGNTYIGSYAGQLATGGHYNTGVGEYASGNASGGTGNTAVGYYAGYAVTGIDNVSLGFQAGSNVTGGDHNISIGYNSNVIDPNGSHYLNIDNSITGYTTVGSTLSFIPSISAPKFYGDGSALTGISAGGGGVSVSTFTLDLHSGGDVFIASGSIIANIGMSYINTDSTMNITGIQCYTEFSSSVSATSFNIMVSTDVGGSTGVGSYLLASSSITVQNNATYRSMYSPWTSPDATPYFTAVSVPSIISLQTVQVPTKGTLPSEYGCIIKYWRKL